MEEGSRGLLGSGGKGEGLFLIFSLASPEEWPWIDLLS
jgi:hypothetical protein